MGMGGHNYLLSALDLGTANQPTPASRDSEKSEWSP